MKKILIIPVLCAAVLTMTLAGCGQPKDNANTTSSPAAASTPLPSATAGTVISTFTGTIKSVKGTTLTIDIQNDSIKTSTVGSPAPSPSPTEIDPSSPSPSPIITTVNVDVPANVPVTLTNGKAGNVANITDGRVAEFTMTGDVITAITIIG